jgi:hypothetical protein
MATSFGRTPYDLRSQPRGRTISIPLGGVSMKKTFVVTAVVGLALLGTAAWAALPQVDPATVPTGLLVANNRVNTPLKVKVDGTAEHRLPNGSEVFINHGVNPPGSSSGGTPTPDRSW